MSKATIRHSNAVLLKQELLHEIHHWKDSSMSCMTDIKNTLNALKKAKAVAKRDINNVRAQLEEMLKQLEENAEKEMFDIVHAEEKNIQGLLKKVFDRRKRLEVTESLLEEELVGIKLTRTIEDGKHQVLAVREALMEVRKREIPSRVEFNLHTSIEPVRDKLVPLGTTVLKTENGVPIKRQRVSMYKNAASHLTIIGATDSENTVDFEDKKIDKTITSEEDTYQANDIEHILKMTMKDNISLKPFLDSVMSLAARSKNIKRNDIDKKNETPNTVSRIAVSRRQDTSLQVKQDELRSQSVFEEEKEDKETVPARLSISARRERRIFNNTGVQNHAYLNGNTFIPYEEQGPDYKATFGSKKKEKPSVRYLDYDFIREITEIKNAKHDEDTNQLVSEPNDSECSIKGISKASSIASLSTASLSSVSYKPSSSLASGTLRVSSSQRLQSNSYFSYMARFHTKKHPYDTDLCRLSGIVALENGQVIVSDINHLKLMLFGPDFSYLFAYDCPSPCGLCIVDQTTVAVTLFHNRKILLVKVFTIHIERHKEIHINCPETLHAVSYRTGRYFVFCFRGDIHVTDGDGKQEATIETKMTGGDARHMEVDDSGKRLYVIGQDRVICFDDSGEKMWQFRGSNNIHRRFTPGGLVIYHERLFVADWRYHKVIELSLDGTHVRDVITDNIEFPRAMGVQASTGKLFVTQSNMFKQEARSRSVKVFNIK